DAGRVIVTGSVEQGGVADNQSASTHVRITVADNGCGMDPETQRRIFEPFFSTRAVGQGTGMGMPVVHGIVTGAGGTVTVDSTPDAGTVFTIRLPAHQPEPCVSPTLPRADAAEAAARPDGDSDEHHPAADLPIAPRVLLVDDEPALVDLLATSLTRAGFRVSGYTDALEALTSIKVDADPYDVVLTDITMPGLRGDQLATRIHESDRSLPIIGYTGHSDRVDREGAVEAGMVDLLAKPLDPNEVIEALKRALRRRGGIDG
ncbi:MAG: response regulator, partial [Spirochaetaceae bacterium]